MNNLFKCTALAVAIAASTCCTTASGQYWELANQATNMITSALQGGANYKGYVDASYLMGVGNKRANVLELTTSQGMRVSSCFYMGLGLGAQMLFTDVPQSQAYPPNSEIGGHGFTTTGLAIPLFSDFRFNLGSESSTGFYADVRVGAAFLAGNDYIQVSDGYLTNSSCFYLRPSVGVRIPVSKSHPKQAINVGVAYQLLSSSYWYISNNNTTLNAIGVNVGFEW